ncbi:nucleotidyl transferase AbiEii/AbiGii toxin family protein [Candidatus Palauibacter sp.]|uniref:nucleotidyl transferase AbiEii/AbiGii toxin family protein n=1 Tax=Candidatus Palauibacter sp. TaxID=3101350 RepID=UPI003AF218C8
MRDHLRSLVRDVDPLRGRNILREYLQARILEGLQRAGAFVTLAFQGGTALRFLYGLPRYSEDLDFALEGDRVRYDLRAWLNSVGRQFQREAYDVKTAIRDRGTVHTASLRFPGLLHENGLSPHAHEVITIKIDVDSNPPAGAAAATRLVRRHVTLRLWHHDRASLLAGKLHAVLQRPFFKGRDVYDLAWYLSDPSWPSPNLVLLNAALGQGDPDAPALTSVTWRAAVARRLETMPWDQLAADVRPFLERGNELPGREEVVGLMSSWDRS